MTCMSCECGSEEEYDVYDGNWKEIYGQPYYYKKVLSEGDYINVLVVNVNEILYKADFTIEDEERILEDLRKDNWANSISIPYKYDNYIGGIVVILDTDGEEGYLDSFQKACPIGYQMINEGKYKYIKVNSKSGEYFPSVDIDLINKYIND